MHPKRRKMRFALPSVLALLAAVVLLSVDSIPSQAQTFTTLYSFNQGTGATGYNPLYVTLAQGRDANLYGTCVGGGTPGNGTVFEMTPTGSLSDVYDFGISTPYEPMEGLLLGTNGLFYGTTWGDPKGLGAGSIFSVTPLGKMTVLYSFDVEYTSPSNLIQGIDGAYSGTTQAGGVENLGSVFKITASGQLTILHSFSGADGSLPYGGLVQAPNGILYGTTYNGGAFGLGTIYKIQPSGAFASMLSFDGAHGSGPKGSLDIANDGKLYGTTAGGGRSGQGTVFRIGQTGGLTLLHSFAGSDGQYPWAGVIQATDGNLYGTTVLGGTDDLGTIFSVTTEGAFAVLHNFDTDGSTILSGLMQHTNGVLYGTTTFGGTFGWGTVYSLDLGLAPLVRLVTSVGKANGHVQILGTGVKGTTAVTFNGLPATFTVDSDTLMGAVVPAGAASGPVEVTTPNGILKGNVDFQVIP